MHIKMLTTQRGSEDGFSVRCFEEGHTYYNVADTLARKFIRMGWAEELEDDRSITEIAEEMKAHADAIRESRPVPTNPATVAVKSGDAVQFLDFEDRRGS